MTTPKEMEVDPVAATPRGTKRKGTTHMNVDIDTGDILPDSKRKNIKLDEGIKVKVLTAMIKGYRALKQKMLGAEKDVNPEYCYNFLVSSQITSIMMTLHGAGRQKVNDPAGKSSLADKASRESFKVEYKGTYQITYGEAEKIWATALTEQGLAYKKFTSDDEENWIGTMSPYLSYSSCFHLRLKEGHFGKR